MGEPVLSRRGFLGGLMGLAAVPLVDHAASAAPRVLPEILLKAPFLVKPDAPHVTRAVTGGRLGYEIGGVRFKAAPDFHLVVGSPWTPMGLVSVPQGMRGLRFVDCEFVGHGGLDPHSADWTVWASGLHAELVDDLAIDGCTFEEFPGFGIALAGVRGCDIARSHSRRTQGFVNADYFVTYKPHENFIRANSSVSIHGFCTHRDGQGGGRPNDEWRSVYDPSEEFGSNSINAVMGDSEIVDFAAVGEVKSLVKLVSPQRVRIARCHGSSIMIQGSCYWDAVRGPNSRRPDGTPLFWPLEGFAEDTVIEDCALHPRLSLSRFYDHPIAASNTIQLSYPQARTVIRRCHLWWEPGSHPSQMQAVQLAEGVEASVIGNTFHKASGPDDPHTVGIGDSAPAAWPSKLNPDWKTANEFAVE